MENKKQGYKVRKYQGPVKRYCQMLNLKNDAALIAEYRKRHSEGKVWPETLAAIREVGILEMEIYILGTNLFMIVETPLDFDWDTPWPEWLRCLARQNGKSICLSFNRQSRERLRLKNGS